MKRFIIFFMLFAMAVLGDPLLILAAKVGQLKRQGASTLARVRYALHRNGIYW